MTARQLKRIVRTGFDLVGYNIERKKNPDRLKKYSHRPSSGSILEMIGPSGVGKSTLFTSIIDELEKDWFQPHHASDLVLSSLDYDAELTEVHRQLLLKKAIRFDKEGHDFWVLGGVLSYGAKVASTNILMRSGFHRGFALDEGLFQVFANELLELDVCARQRLCVGRYLVLLNARDPNTIAKRAFLRHKNRLLRGHFQHPTTIDKQREHAIKAMSLYEKVAEIAQDCGVEVLRLFAEDEDSENRQAILTFARKISCAKA